MQAIRTPKGKKGDRLWVRIGNQRVQAICLSDVDGKAIALLTDEGNWYLLGESQPFINQGSAKIIEYRKSRSTKQDFNFGVLIWLDCVWLINSGNPPNPISKIQNKAAFLSVIKYFLGGKKKIFTLPSIRSDVSEARLDDGNFYNVAYGIAPTPTAIAFPYASEVLAEENIQVIEIDLTQANAIATITGLFFVPLMPPESRLSALEISQLKKISRRHGVIICGEVAPWDAYINSVLAGFGVGERISFFSNVPLGNWIPTTNNKLAKKITVPYIDTESTGTFVGAKSSEIVSSLESGEATMILIKVI